MSQLMLDVLHGRLDGEILFLGSQPAVQGSEQQTAIGGETLELAGAPFDPCNTREEDQDVAVVQVEGPSDGGSRGPRYAFLRTRANSIEGGTTEIMKNILGEQVLGLPGEPRVDKGIPWSQVPRS